MAAPIQYRAPLAEIDTNRAPNAELSPAQRSFIQGARRGGETAAKIAGLINCHPKTIYDTLKRYRTINNGVSKPRKGRPTVLTEQDERALIRIARRDPQIEYKHLLEQAGVTCSSRTVSRLFKDYGITNWRAKRRPVLTPLAAQRRFEWAQAHQTTN